MPDKLTCEFKVAREAAKMEGDKPPTFHEVRSLGGAMLMQEKGWTLKQVQELMGHASEAMTENYLEGHDIPWQEVTPGLSLPA
ncbi:tyrosine-type recombinase/integrase [Pseudoxanthomonas suwonensis]|uniref:tyrosine-type recombinase/integrase n=1 Tax=Pseudoxanthomonas suwonensis TaxID=314722 RepID=UPI000A6802BB|nr:tyrosine-type recombinase/integrase [Pseudoxanthomonas suwonensis]